MMKKIHNTILAVALAAFALALAAPDAIAVPQNKVPGADYHAERPVSPPTRVCTKCGKHDCKTCASHGKKHCSHCEKESKSYSDTKIGI